MFSSQTQEGRRKLNEVSTEHYVNEKESCDEAEWRREAAADGIDGGLLCSLCTLKKTNVDFN